MARTRRFRFIDGREIDAASPLGFFQRLQESDGQRGPTLSRYLDLLRCRLEFLAGVEVDFGRVEEDDVLRCRTALASLMSHVLVRIDGRPRDPGPRLMLY
jgi:hypothetical protein